MYRDILVATDGSTGGERAVDHALGLAKGLDATLHGLAVLKEGVTTRDQIRADPEGEAEAALNTLKEAGDERGIAITREIRTGDPCETIVAYAEEREVDLIVIGTTSGTRLDRFLHGSTTGCVSKKATVPVMTVGAEADPLFDQSEDAEFQFHCPKCDSSLQIEAETRDALLEKGCIICGADVTEDAFIETGVSSE